jgi:hypothetical protein
MRLKIALTAGMCTTLPATRRCQTYKLITKGTTRTSDFLSGCDCHRHEHLLSTLLFWKWGSFLCVCVFLLRYCM